MKNDKKIIAILNCHDDDVFCFRKEIIDDLADAGYMVLISCPYGERIEKIKRNNVIYEDISIDRRGTNPFRDYQLYHSYKKLFKRYKPIVVLTFTIKPNIYGGLASRKLGIPYINNITGLGSAYEKGGLLKQTIILLYKIVLNSAYYVLFQNETNKRTIVEAGVLQHKRYEVIPGSGVNLERFKYRDYPKSKSIVFNYIGRVMKDKNIDDFIYIAQRLHKKYDNVVFNIIGFIEQRESRYEKVLDELEKQKIIKYLGPQMDVRPSIEESHAIIHPSTYGEGLSNVLLESAAIGRVLIAARVPGCMEIVKDGVNGFLFEPNNREMMVELVERFIKLPLKQKEEMGKASRKIVEEKYSRKIVVEKYRELVNEICEGKNK